MPVLKNARHEKFAQEMAKGATQDAAYRAAGYKPSRPAASRMTTKFNIPARIAELIERAAAKTEITLERVMREYAAVGFARTTDYLDDQGHPIKDFSKLTDEQKAALGEITIDQLDVQRDGKVGKETTRIRFKMHNKLEALTRLREHLGFVVKTRQDGTIDANVRVVTGFDEA